MTHTRKTYNGHSSYNAWNVSLWIGNDEGLYHLARECKRMRGNSRKAAEDFIELVGTSKTPDGAPWTVTNVAKAIAGLD